MTAQQLRETRAKLISDAREIRDRADRATRDLTAEEVGQQTAMLADARRTGDELRALEDLEREENLTTLPETQRTGRSPDARAQMEACDTALRGVLRSAAEGRGPVAMECVPAPGELRAREHRTMSTLAGADGGFSIAPDVSMYGQI